MLPPFCPVCNTNVDDLVIYPHGVRIPDEDDTDKNKELVMPQFLFIQHRKCGHVFGIVDSGLHDKVGTSIILPSYPS